MKSGNKLPFELIELDITSDESISTCMKTLLSKTDSVDALVNNAGIGVCGSAEETSVEHAYRQMETNFWGAVKLTRAILPVMRKQRHGKIITIGSLAGLVGVPYQSYYSASKHALEGFYKALRLELHHFNIDVSVIEPGFFRSNLHSAFIYPVNPIPEYDRMRQRTFKVLDQSIEHGKTPEPVARIVLKILETKKPKFSYPVGPNSFLAPFMQFFAVRIYEFAMRRKFGL